MQKNILVMKERGYSKCMQYYKDRREKTKKKLIAKNEKREQAKRK